MNSTIFALATAPGRAGVGVVRLSGPGAAAAIETLAGPLPSPREASLRRLAYRGASIDQALILWFPAPHSFTGEDVAEFHIHGGRAVREALFSALLAMGFCPAEAGQFSRRAVENGKLDLTRAEAIADLTDAETPAQLRQALRQYDGALADLLENWRSRLIDALARAEAAIDFSDDGIGEREFARARHLASEISKEIQVHVDSSGRGESLREGLRLTVLGPPNAGKSSLVNALARREVAIVSQTPGTTRDVVEARLDLGGFLVTVADTAGLRETNDAVEAEGMRRALLHAAGGITLLLLDGSLENPRGDLPPQMPEPDLVVWNKSDLGFRRQGPSISLKTGGGLSELLEMLRRKVQQKLEGDGAPFLTRARHRHALGEALAALGQAVRAPGERPELLAEDLRLAMRAIGRITGQVDVEELLDSVFRDFCIGK